MTLMAKFDLSDQPKIDPTNPIWKTIEAWAQHTIERKREERETPSADLRKLDAALGSIQAMKTLLGLPAAIKKERQRDDPVKSDGFGIPPPKGY